MITTAIGRTRLVGLLEGTSYILLLGVAMPLKYLADQPEAVKYMGWVHGMLFMLYGLVILHAWATQKLNLKWSFIALVASVLPFGPFILDGKLRALSNTIAD